MSNNENKTTSLYEKDLDVGYLLINNISTAKFLYDRTLLNLSTIKETPTYRNIVNALFLCFNEISYYGDDYIMKEWRKISYELAFDIYYNINCSIPIQKSIEFTYRGIADEYIARSGIAKLDPVKQAKLFSRERKSLLKEFDPESYAQLRYAQHYHKYKEYKNIILPAISALPHEPQQMSLVDLFFYVCNHRAGNFSCTNFIVGNTFRDFYDILQTYKNLHEKDIPSNCPVTIEDENLDKRICCNAFDSELSAYIFEKAYCGISFSKFVLSFIKHDFVDISIPDDEVSLFLFSKLYDSRHLSIVNYIENKYVNELASFFNKSDADDIHYFTYQNFQINNAFILPMLYHILTVLLRHFYQDNDDAILKTTKKYITHYFKKHGFIYRCDLYNTVTEIDKLDAFFTSTANAKNQKYKLKHNILFTQKKKDHNTYLFNLSLFDCFFKRDMPSLIGSYITTFDSDSEQVWSVKKSADSQQVNPLIEASKILHYNYHLHKTPYRFRF